MQIIPRMDRWENYIVLSISMELTRHTLHYLKCLSADGSLAFLDDILTQVFGYTAFNCASFAQ